MNHYVVVLLDSSVDEEVKVGTIADVRVIRVEAASFDDAHDIAEAANQGFEVSSIDECTRATVDATHARIERELIDHFADVSGSADEFETILGEHYDRVEAAMDRHYRDVDPIREHARESAGYYALRAALRVAEHYLDASWRGAE